MQLYVVFVFAEGGFDLEHFQFANWSQVQLMVVYVDCL